jgi:hypothetical protein
MPVSLDPAVMFAERGSETVEFGGEGGDEAAEVVVC